MTQTAKELELFVPGRLCIFGEHTDWAARYLNINAQVPPGLAIVAGIDLGIRATAKRGGAFAISSFGERGQALAFSCDMDPRVLRAQARSEHFFRCACGAAAYMAERYGCGGACINVVKATLPIKKGLSSSAAVCVLVVRAFNRLYDLAMSADDEMRAAYLGERLTSSGCGRLDQICAQGPQAVVMEFSGDEVTAERLPVGGELFLVCSGLNGQKNTARILSDLSRAYPFARTARERRVHEALGRDNRALVERAAACFARGDAEGIGSLMTRAQALFDEKVAPLCPELKAPRLHALLADARVRALTYGGKTVGSGGDGSAQFIAKDKAAQMALVDYLSGELKLAAYPLSLPPSAGIGA